MLALVLLGLLTIVLLGAALIGSLLRDPRRADVSPAPTVESNALAVDMQPIQIDDFNVRLQIPETWQMVPSEIVEYRVGEQGLVFD